MLNDRLINSQKTLGLGCSTFGGSKSKKEALRALHHSYHFGIRYFDVARSYGYGQAESILGEFFKGKRDQVTITSKFGITPPKPFPFMSQVKDTVRVVKKWMPGLTQRVIQSYSGSTVSRPIITPELAIQSLEKSLCELKTDYLDFYLLHNCSFDNVMKDDIYAALENAKAQGKIKEWGSSCESEEELPLYFKKGASVPVVQFPYTTDNKFVGHKSPNGMSKVIFSVMNPSVDCQEPSREFFEQLLINQLAPGLIQNLHEAWLYVASRELDQGVVLCSMTQAGHIQRNVEIMEGPDVPDAVLKRMKQKLLAGERTPAYQEIMRYQRLQPSPF